MVGSEEERAIALVDSAWGAWAGRAVDEALSLLDPGVVYVLTVDGSVAPFGGEYRGHEAMRALMETLRGEFVYLRYITDSYVAAGNVVRFKTHFTYRHKATGELVSGSYRVVATVGNGLVTRIEEYPDAAIFEALYRLMGGGDLRSR